MSPGGLTPDFMNLNNYVVTLESPWKSGSVNSRRFRWNSPPFCLKVGVFFNHHPNGSSILKLVVDWNQGSQGHHAITHILYSSPKHGRWVVRIRKNNEFYLICVVSWNKWSSSVTSNNKKDMRWMGSRSDCQRPNPLEGKISLEEEMSLRCHLVTVCDVSIWRLFLVGR